MSFHRLIRKLSLVVDTEQKEEGVTLIEMLAVVVILGVISAISVPVVSNAILNAKVSTTETDLANLQVALERYNEDHSSYPVSLTQLTEQTYQNGATTGGTGSTFGPYINLTFPENDAFGNPIAYTPTGTPSAAGVLDATSATGYLLVSSDGNSSTITSAGKLDLNTIGSTANVIYAGAGTDPGPTAAAQSSAGKEIASQPTLGNLSTFDANASAYTYTFK